ncbi:hypothetical protein M407DRAFT_247012 [Tulasnella calospora MUT 4182]|uniref:Uncharacterized protein n=1 Tax=Tulasnella calospora MUT 4182 TaxID=1051891 RepID=A0A0C3PPD1_9AGAM|nr:hypothetical protein M407DRAFT_247012 [Tulasnella calospora MUT 4182]
MDTKEESVRLLSTGREEDFETHYTLKELKIPYCTTAPEAELRFPRTLCANVSRTEPAKTARAS